MRSRRDLAGPSLPPRMRATPAAVPRRPTAPSRTCASSGPREGKFLYVDGSCASVWQPGVRITGGSWDLLAAPVLLVPAGRAPRVLLLGVGGGTVIRVVRALCPEARDRRRSTSTPTSWRWRGASSRSTRSAPHIEIADAQRFLRRAAARRALRRDRRRHLRARRHRHAKAAPAGARPCAAPARACTPVACWSATRSMPATRPRALSASLPKPVIALAHADYHNHILVGGRRRSDAREGRARAARLPRCSVPTMRRTTVRALNASEPVGIPSP